MRGIFPCLTGLALLAAEPAAAQEFDPGTLDLPALIECRADVPAYNGFAFWLTGEAGAIEKLGWRKVDSNNPFLSQYELEKPVVVFGEQTKSIVFTSSGPMAVLDGVAATDVAKKLGIQPLISSSQKFLGEKVVSDKTETAEGVTFATRISLNVSTVETHPGKVLAGCSYKIEVQ